MINAVMKHATSYTWQSNCSKWTLCARTEASSLFHHWSVALVYHTHQPLPRICHILCWRVVDLLLHQSPNAVISQTELRPFGRPHVRKLQSIPEFHDEAAALFDLHDEPVHRPAERCKFHQRCFRVIGMQYFHQQFRLDNNHRRFCSRFHMTKTAKFKDGQWLNGLVHTHRTAAWYWRHAFWPCRKRTRSFCVFITHSHGSARVL